MRTIFLTLAFVGCASSTTSRDDSGTTSPDASVPQAPQCAQWHDERPLLLNAWAVQISDAGVSPGASGCTQHGNYPESHDFGFACAGRATASIDGGTVLRLDDDSTLSWDPVAAGGMDAPVLSEGDVVTIDARLNAHVYGLGVGHTKHVSIQRPDGGPTLWFAKSEFSSPSDGLNPFDTSAVFGVSATTELNCAVPGNGVIRTKFDHLLATTPVTRIPNALERRVTTPTGTWDVWWTLRVDEPDADGGARTAVDMDFAARFVGPR